MKNLDKKKVYGIFGTVLILIIVIIIIVSVSMGGSKVITEASLKNAATKYYTKNPTLLPQNNYDSANVSISTLISSGYLSSDRDGASCPSYVVVTNINGTYEYTPFIKCDTNTNKLVNKLMLSSTTSGEGLYSYNGKYIFRGANPNNFVKFGDKLWRIIGIDNSGNIKIISISGFGQYSIWDNKYNSIIDKASGINDYLNSEGESTLKTYLNSYFKDFPEIFTSARISRLTKYDVCIGKANLETNSINTCADILPNQIASIITVEDYLNASLDPNCKSTNTKNCQNYNFLNIRGWTITGNSANNYQVYYIDEYEGIKLQNASFSKAVRPVLALRSDISCISGTGTELDPYVVK